MVLLYIIKTHICQFSANKWIYELILSMLTLKKHGLACSYLNNVLVRLYANSNRSQAHTHTQTHTLRTIWTAYPDVFKNRSSVVNLTLYNLSTPCMCRDPLSLTVLPSHTLNSNASTISWIPTCFTYNINKCCFLQIICHMFYCQDIVPVSAKMTNTYF